MFKVKNKDSSCCWQTSIDVALVSFVVNFKHISHFFLVFSFLTLNMKLLYSNDNDLFSGGIYLLKVNQ